MSKTRKVDVPVVIIAKADAISKITGLPRTKAFGLMGLYVPVISGGNVTNMKNGKKKVILNGNKRAWNFEI